MPPGFKAGAYRTHSISMIRTNTYSMIRTNTYSMIRTNTYSMIRTNTYSMIRTNTYSMIRTNTYSMIRTNVYSMIRTNTYSFSKNLPVLTHKHYRTKLVLYKKKNVPPWFSRKYPRLNARMWILLHPARGSLPAFVLSLVGYVLRRPGGLVAKLIACLDTENEALSASA